MSFINKSSQKFVPKARGRARARPSTATAPPDQDKVALPAQDGQEKPVKDVESQVENTQMDESQVDGTQLQSQHTNDSQVDSAEVDGTQVDGTQVDSTQVDSTQVDGTQLDSTQVDGIQVDETQVDSTQLDATQIQSPPNKQPESIKTTPLSAPKPRPMFKLGVGKSAAGTSASPVAAKPRTTFTPRAVPRSSARTNLSQAIPKSTPPAKVVSSLPKGPISRPSGGVKKPAPAPVSKLPTTVPKTPSRRPPAISTPGSGSSAAAPIPLSSPSGPTSPLSSPVSARSRNAASIPMTAPPQSPSRPPTSVERFREKNRSPIGRARTSNVRGGNSDVEEGGEEGEDGGTFRTSYVRGGGRSTRGDSPERPRVSSFAPINAYIRDTFEELPSRLTRAVSSRQAQVAAARGDSLGRPIHFEEPSVRPGRRGAKRKRVAAVRTSRASPPLARMRSPSPALSLPSPSPVSPPASPPSPPRKVYPVDENGNVILDPEDIKDRPWEIVESDGDDDLQVIGQAEVQTNSQPKPKKKYVINTNKFTMADMCKDIPFAEKNDAFDEFEKYRQEKKMKRLQILQKKKEYRLQGRVYIPDETLEEERKRLEDERKNQWNEEFKSSEGDKGEPAALQLKMAADGTVILDMDSTIVDRHKATSQKARQEKEAEDDQTDEHKFGPGFTALSYSKRVKGDRWDDMETKEFYRAISQWGTDFALISQLFPGRTRRQIKLKFKQEERKNPAVIHLALIRKLPIDLNTYSSSMNSGLQSAREIENELEELQRRHEAQLRLDDEAREKAKREDVEAAEKAEEEQFGTVSTKRVKKKEDPELLGLHEDEEFVGYVGQVN
ncbi:hypothetical protein TRVA0_047S00166 [Trichomonascus vanleenenianus]|uniref:transcription factor TFIIIB subunit BDP1 n=1 Tax=Trichomonascus vanleenenianus TaxID=2268995 RepID=UPI003ECB2418